MTTAGEWYRYHHLFADVLQARVDRPSSPRVSDLHRRGSAWHWRHGEQAAAIDHVLAAGDFGRAAELLELAIPMVRRDRREAAFCRWLESLPDELVRARPVLSVSYAGALLASGELEGVEPLLQDAERWLEVTANSRVGLGDMAGGMVVVDEAGFRRLGPAIAVYRAAQAQAAGDVAATVTHAQRALELTAEDDHLGRGSAAGFLGLAAWASGDLDGAHRSYAAGMASLQRARACHRFARRGGHARRRPDRPGQARDALSTYEEAVRVAAKHGGARSRERADMYVGMSDLLREHGDLEAAGRHLMQSQESGEHTGLPQNRYRWRIASARIRQAEGDLGGSLDLLDEAERLYVGGFSSYVAPDYSPNVRPIPALKARVWVEQGRLDYALRWARQHGVSDQDDVSYLREFEHITLARVLLAQFRSDNAEGTFHQATAHLERLLRAAEEGGRTGGVIEILVLQALAAQLRGVVPAALVPLERALNLAEPEGYVQTFIGEGPPIAVLLATAAAAGSRPPSSGDYSRPWTRTRTGRRRLRGSSTHSATANATCSGYSAPT